MGIQRNSDQQEPRITDAREASGRPHEQDLRTEYA